MYLEDFDYFLPKGFIAQEPVFPRDHSKLLVVKDSIKHDFFYNIVDYLEDGDVLILNETKVLHAKLVGNKVTGAKVELIVEEVLGSKCKCRITATKPRVGNKLLFQDYSAEIVDQKDDFFVVQFDDDVNKIMDHIGILPTPPYVKKELEKDSQYQTCYSKIDGSVAAPTAGLHFTPQLLKKIQDKGVKIARVCLHVGFGTFLPVKDINRSSLHKEYFEIDKQNADVINNRKGRLIAVGTTSVRALESAADEKGVIHPVKTNTDLFIKPGYIFKSKINALITNFHLPKSTLLMLVSAFIGRERILDAYEEAKEHNYRFFSFGDSCLFFR